MAKQWEQTVVRQHAHTVPLQLCTYLREEVECPIDDGQVGYKVVVTDMCLQPQGTLLATVLTHQVSLHMELQCLWLGREGRGGKGRGEGLHRTNPDIKVDRFYGVRHVSQCEHKNKQF